MIEYVVSSGRLAEWDPLDEPRLERMKDASALVLTAKAPAQSRHGASHRVPDPELRFLHRLLQREKGNRSLLCGFADIHGSRASDFAQLLRTARLRWARLSYGPAEDDLILVEMADLREGFENLAPAYPPEEGEVFFHTGRVIFDMFEVHWRRRSLRSARKERRLRAGILDFALQAERTILVDTAGTIVLVSPRHDPSLPDRVGAAARDSGIALTTAPTLFS